MCYGTPWKSVKCMSSEFSVDLIGIVFVLFQRRKSLIIYTLFKTKHQEIIALRSNESVWFLAGQFKLPRFKNNEQDSTILFISDTLPETVPECVKCGLALGAAIRILIEGDESQS